MSSVARRKGSSIDVTPSVLVYGPGAKLRLDSSIDPVVYVSSRADNKPPRVKLYSRYFVG